MKKLYLSIIVLFTISSSFAATNPVDSLLRRLNSETNDSLKAKWYSQVAEHYMHYNAIQDNQLKTAYQEFALRYTLSALHHYSRLDDTTGLRVSFDRLARVYHDQKKYSQAKWFILQSNTLAREKNDVPNIITSLVKLAYIKMDIKDYDLAKGDLKEALALASTNCLSNQQADVMQSYVTLYRRTKQFPEAAISKNRYTYIKDSIKRDSVKEVAKLHFRKKYYLASTGVLHTTAQKTIAL